MKDEEEEEEKEDEEGKEIEITMGLCSVERREGKIHAYMCFKVQLVSFVCLQSQRASGKCCAVQRQLRSAAVLTCLEARKFEHPDRSSA